MTTEFATTVAGGNEKTEYFVLSVRAEASPARSVDMAAISPPSISDQDKAREGHGREREECYPCDKEKADIHRS